jgi:hypothetical protein
MNFLKISVIVLFVILTILTINIRPELHQPMIIEDADFKLTRISDTITTTTTVTTTTPQTTQQQEQQLQQEQPIQQSQQMTQTQQVQIVEQPIQQYNKPVQQTQTQRVINVKPVQQEKTQIELLQDFLNTDIEDSKKIEENAQKLAQSLQQPKTQQQTVTQPKQTSSKNPYMTEQEEIIAWNKWRSDIQNQIMKDSKIDYVPLGTIFNFTFIVDKFGNISNIKVECSNQNYMEVARKNVKPAIANLQRKPILNFPRGTQRTTTVFEGKFMISTKERYSTPGDYVDYERVKR